MAARRRTLARWLGGAALSLSLGSGALAGAVSAQSAPVVPTNDAYGYADFYGVPHLGTETASGTGCGGDGSIGDVIPDGYWRGYVRGLTPGAIQFDLVCVYGNNVNPDLVAEWRADHPGQADPWVPDGYLINADDRVRTVPVGPTFFSHGAAFGPNSTCAFNQSGLPFDNSRDAWLRIVNGQAQWAVSSCSPPPTTPSFNFPYASFFGVPQLGREPVQGSGCGGDGSIGDTIPDGLWFGFAREIGDASMQFDLACVYVGDTGQRLQDEYYAQYPDELEHGALVAMPQGWLVNNSDRLRTIPLQDNFLLAYSQFSSFGAPNWPSRDGTQSCVAPVDPTITPSEQPGPEGYGFGQYGNGEWVNIVNGHAQWVLANCLYS